MKKYLLPLFLLPHLAVASVTVQINTDFPNKITNTITHQEYSIGNPSFSLPVRCDEISGGCITHAGLYNCSLPVAEEDQTKLTYADHGKQHEVMGDNSCQSNKLIGWIHSTQYERITVQLHFVRDLNRLTLSCIPS